MRRSVSVTWVTYMKTCPYCGKEYSDEATMCPTDHTPFDQPVEPPAPEPQQVAEDEFPPLTEAQKRLNLVTLIRCATLPEADIIAGRLRAAGIDVFIPDESFMQFAGGYQNAFGYIRVQVSPRDYDAAKKLISAE
jgi:hypothetical protein